MRVFSALCRIVSMTVLTTVILATSAFASKYDSVAQELKTIGLFQGTESSFDLDRAPTRTEAAVMLVRLLGAENVAKTQYADGKITNPFTDVEDWAAPYVAWLYKYGLAKGISDTAFGAEGQCTAKMYCTFVLRSLGYSDAEGGDFTFDEATAVAEYLGLYDSDDVGETFFRDDVVVISYRALAANLNNSGTCLLEKLISDGAVSATGTATLLNKVKTYNDYCEAYYDYASVSAVNTTTTRSLRLKNMYTSANYTYDENIAYSIISTEDNLQMSWIDNLKQGEDSYYQASWIKDGYYYYENNSQNVKIELTADFLNELFSSDASTRMPLLDEVKSISKTSVAEGTKYVISFADSFDYFGYVNDNMDLGFDATELVSYSVSNCTLTVVVGNGGLISSFKNEYSANFKYYFNGFLVPLSLDNTDYEIVNATGNSVYINFPDFSVFTELS